MDNGLLDIYMFVFGWAALYFGVAAILLINRQEKKKQRKQNRK